MDLIYFIKGLYKRKWIIIAIMLMAMVAALVFTRQEKRKYNSTAQLATGFTMNDIVSLSDHPSDIYSSELKFSNIIETMTSPQVLNLLSCSLILHDLDNPKTAFRTPTENDLRNDDLGSIDIEKAKSVFRDKLSGIKMLSSFSPFERKLLKLLDAYGYDQESLRECIDVHRLNRTDFVNIDCETDNPILSAFIVNDLCKEFNRFYARFMSQRTAGNVQMLDTLKDRKLQILDEKQTALKNVLQGGDADVVQSSSDLINQYQSKLVGKRSDLTAAKLALAAVNKQIESLNNDVGGQDNNNSTIVQLNREINNLTAQYLNSGGVDKELAERINSLKGELQKQYNSASLSSLGQLPSKGDLLQKKSDLEVQVEASESDIKDLQGTISRLSGNLKTSAGRDIMIQALQREVEQAQADYNKVNEKYGMAVNGLAQFGTFKQTLFGQPSINPEKSKRTVIVALAGITVGFLTVFSIILLLYFDVSVKTPSTFKKMTGIGLLSSTNWINLRKADVMKVVTESPTDKKKVNRKRHNLFKEHIRKIRQSLDGTSSQVILFTSTEHGQGKTTLIQALAYSMSLSRKRVLLIDTNFCNNDLTVQTKAKGSLETFSVTGPLKRGDLEQIITHLDIPGVDVIGCEGGDYTPSEVLAHGNILEHFEEIKKMYDYILLESAPMNSYTDTSELVEFVDVVVSIFSAEATIKPADLNAIEFLKKLNGKFKGAILNKVELDNLEA